jgi:hypothetical protein
LHGRVSLIVNIYHILPCRLEPYGSPNHLSETGGPWRRSPMEAREARQRDTEDGHSESASLDLSLSFRCVLPLLQFKKTVARDLATFFFKICLFFLCTSLWFDSATLRPIS